MAENSRNFSDSHPRKIDVITTSASRRARLDCAVSTLTALGSKEAEMRIIGCDLHTAQQTVALDSGSPPPPVPASTRRSVRGTQHHGERIYDFTRLNRN